MRKYEIFRIILFCFLITPVPGINAQVELIYEVRISDKGLYFDGDKISSSEFQNYANKPGYDFYFGRRITPHGDCIASYGKYIFMTWYRGGEEDRHVMLSRYNTESGTLASIEFPHRHNGYLNSIHVGESHNTIAVGICKLDSTIHLLYDMHAYSENRPSDGSLANDYFRYSYSKKGALTVPDKEFTIDQFYPKQLFLKAGENYKSLTYPKFFENSKGALMVCMREGGHNNGKYMFCKYDPEGWTGWTDFNVLNANQRPEVSYNWGLYGDIKYQAGKMRIGFHTRYAISTDKHALNNGFFYAYSNDPAGKTDWYNYKDEPISLPVINPNELLFYEPADQVSSNATDASYISTGADWAVNDREDIHFRTSVKDGAKWIEVHAYKKAEDIGFFISTSLPEGDLYGVGNSMYLIGLENGYPTIYKAEGGTNDWQEVYRATSGKRFRHGNVLIEDGLLYFYLMEDRSGDAQPIYLQSYRLDSEIPVESLKPFQIQWTSNEDFEQFVVSQANSIIRDDLLQLTIQGDYPKVAFNKPFDAGPLDKVRLVVKNESLSDLFWLAWYSKGVKHQKRFEPTPGVSDTSFHSYGIDLGSDPEWKGIVDYFILETANTADSGIITIDTIEFITKEEVSVQKVIITTNGKGSVNPTSGTCYTGQQVIFQAIPDKEYEFVGWSGDAINSENPLFLSVKSDMNLTANFSPLPEKFTITTYGFNGSVLLTPYKTEYYQGDSVLLTAEPDNGFVFESWSGDLSGTENPVFVRVDSNLSIGANFPRVRYTLNIVAENGHVKKHPDQPDYPEGESVIMKAFPDEGFFFENWSGDASDSLDRISIKMDSNKSVIANFSPLQTAVSLKKTGSLMLYPNPSTGIFFLDEYGSGTTRYRCFNSLGVEIHSGILHSGQSIEIEQKGIYYLQMETDRGWITQKLIVQ